MRHHRTLLAGYLLMAAWLLLGSGRRIALDLLAGGTPDWAPFVGAGIGLAALLLAVPSLDDAIPHRLRERGGP